MLKKWIIIGAAILIGIVLLDKWSKSNNDYAAKNRDTYSSYNNSSDRNTAYGRSDVVPAYVKMSTVFVGTPSQNKIKSILEPVMTLHNMDINEDNLTRCADVLVALRKSSDGKITEMEILDYMYRSKIDRLPFADHAALAFTFLTTGI